MAEVRYIGPAPAVDVSLGGSTVRVENGKAIKVTEDEARSLCRQSRNWERATKPAAKKKDEVTPDGD